MRIAIKLKPTTDETLLAEATQKLLGEFLREKLHLETAKLAEELIARLQSKNADKRDDADSGPGLVLAGALEIARQQASGGKQLKTELTAALAKYANKAKEQGKSKNAKQDLRAEVIEKIEKKLDGLEKELDYQSSIKKIKQTLVPLGKDVGEWFESHPPAFDKEKWQLKFIEGLAIELARQSRLGE